MIIQIEPATSASYAVQMFKGGSSKRIREEFPELIEFYWGDSFWADGFFSESVGQCNEDIIKSYVKRQ